MDIRAIRNERDYNWALTEIERYFVKLPKPGTPAADRFDVLAALIEVYESKRWSIDRLDPIDAIKGVMEIAGYSQKELAELLGSSSRASEILKKKRPLTLPMIHKLHEEWHIPAEVLIRPYPVEAA